MENVSQMSLIEVAYQLMQKYSEPQNIYSLIKEALELKGLDTNDTDLITQVYVDLIASSKFVYMGEDKWDLKSRQSLDQFDKDGSAFNSKDDEYIEEEEAEIEEEDDDFESDELDDEDDEEVSDSDDEDEVDYEESESIQPEYSDDEDDSYDDVDVDDHFDEDFDEDKYNDYMDDYEKMYE